MSHRDTTAGIDDGTFDRADSEKASLSKARRFEESTTRRPRHLVGRAKDDHDRRNELGASEEATR